MTTRHKSRQRLRTIWRIPDDLWVEFQALLVTVPRGATPHRLRRHLYPVADDRTQSPERRSEWHVVLGLRCLARIALFRYGLCGTCILTRAMRWLPGQLRRIPSLLLRIWIASLSLAFRRDVAVKSLPPAGRDWRLSPATRASRAAQRAGGLALDGRGGGGHVFAGPAGIGPCLATGGGPLRRASSLLATRSRTKEVAPPGRSPDRNPTMRRRKAEEKGSHLLPLGVHATKGACGTRPRSPLS